MDHDPLLREGPFGDIRDTLEDLPWVSHGYAFSDIFTVRHQIIRELDPQPATLFEFGALNGYFLVTAVDAAPSIRKIGWIDIEDEPFSNSRCYANLSRYFHDRKREHELWFGTRTNECRQFGPADLVQVDGAHSYTDTITDLYWALEMKPRTVFVDDYAAIEGVKQATDDFAQAQELEVEYHETVNGLAVLRL